MSGDVVNSDGEYNINAEGWDPEALSLTLNAIHNRTKAIPSKLTLEILCKVTVLVDYYELYDILSFFTSVWIETLRGSLPIRYDRDLILWICKPSASSSFPVILGRPTQIITAQPTLRVSPRFPMAPSPKISHKSSSPAKYPVKQYIIPRHSRA